MDTSYKNSVGLSVTVTERCFVKNNRHSLVYFKDTGFVTLNSLNNDEIEYLKIKILIRASRRISELFVPLSFLFLLKCF